MAKILASSGALSLIPHWTGEAVIAAFDTPAAAAEAALAISAAIGNLAGLRIGGDYGVVRVASNPFGGPLLLTGAAATMPAQIVHSTPDSAIHVTEDFAAALCAGAVTNRPRVEFIGELTSGAETPTRLFSIRR